MYECMNVCMYGWMDGLVGRYMMDEWKKRRKEG
jgi:hypothetical protein